jgi:hypothetical protein
MSIHGSYPPPFSSFSPDSNRKELETGSGILRFDAREHLEKISDPRAWFLDQCIQLGTPVSQSADKDIILSVRNEGFGDDDSRTRGPNTNRKLGFHTDRCDVIAFLCLMPAKEGGENHVVNSENVEKLIRKERPDLHKALTLPFPYKKHVVDSGNQRPYVMQPIFSQKEGFFACSYLRVLIDRADQDEHCPSLSQIQLEAINYLDQVCERSELQTTFMMKRGEILFLNNWTRLHRRTAFTDHSEISMRRHLLRVWLSMPNSRPLDDSFQENFGSTLAGSIRGGMQPNN